MPDSKLKLRLAFRRFEQEIPHSAGKALRWLRHPASRLLRVPAGVLLIIGGIFSILPVLGIWMLPLGLLLIAYDVPSCESQWRASQWLVQKDGQQPESGYVGDDRTIGDQAVRWGHRGK